MNRRCAPLLALLALLIAARAADPSARLELPDPLVPNVPLEGALVVENAPAQIKNVILPQVAGLTWHITSGTSYSTTIINGVSSTSETVRLAVRVQAAGTLAIPPVTVELQDGRTLATPAVTVNAQTANAHLTGEAYAEAQFDPPAIVPGEPTTLIYRLYLRQDRDRAIEKPEIAPPTDAIELAAKSESKGNTFDAEGTQWNVLTYRWPITFAQAGSYEVRGQQTYYRCQRDFFNRLTPVSNHQVAVKPATLTVTPMPSEGRPADFTGLFGPLAVSAALERNRIADGEGTVLTLTVTGRQTALLARPSLSLAAGLQAYAKEEPTTKPEKEGAASGEGTRTFRWDVVPSAPGDFLIPAFSFSYFDPSARSYRRADTNPLTLNVLPGRNRSLAVSGAPVTVASTTPAMIATHDELPPPLRGLSPLRPANDLAWRAAIAALALGALLGFRQRWRARTPAVQHRGRQLRRALASHDLDRIAHALHQLLPALDGDQRQLATQVQEAIDLARFGGQPLADQAIAQARRLEDVP